MSVRDALRRLLPRRSTRANPALPNPAAPLTPPTAPRMNRNALTIAAAAAGMLAIAVVVLIQPPPPPGANAAPSPPATPGTYLDQPLRNDRAAAAAAGPPPTGPSAAASGAAVGLAPGFGNPTAAGPPGATSGAASSTSPASAYAAAGDTGMNTVVPTGGAVYAVSAAPLPPRSPTLAELRRAAYRKALTASAAYDEAAASRESDTTPVGAASSGPALAPGFGPSARGAARPDAVLAAVDGVAQGDPRDLGVANVAPAGRYTAFLANAAQPRRTVQTLTVDPAPGAFAVQAGTVIPAVLMTEINSDLPGECLAQTTRDVFDTRSQHVLLIPRGARLLCRYDDQLGAGQSRLLVAWTRILLPDGRSVQLPGLPATDQAGARGVADQVDRHVRRTFATAGALSLLSAGVQLSQPQNGNLLAAPSAGQVAAGALGQQLNAVAVEMLRRDLNNQQTIRIRQGTQFNVFLNTDLVFPGPYGGAGNGYAPRGAAVARGAGAP